MKNAVEKLTFNPSKVIICGSPQAEALHTSASADVTAVSSSTAALTAEVSRREDRAKKMFMFL
jgi:hypothetical protein